MSRPSSSAPKVDRLIEQLNSADASTASQAIGRAARAAARSNRTALRLAQGGAVPAFARALQSADEDVAADAAAMLVCVARAAPNLVAGATGALAAVLGRLDGALAAQTAAWVFVFLADHNPSRVAAEPGAFQALASALRSADDCTVSRAASALSTCAGASPGLARAVAGAPGALAGLCEAAASDRDPQVVDAAVGALLNLVNVGGSDLAPRIVSARGVMAALTRTLLSADACKARAAACVLSCAAAAGPEHARAVATPAALAALASAAGREGLATNCTAALSIIAAASPQLAQRVAGAPGAGAALLTALTGRDEVAGANAARALSRIADADAERFGGLVSDAPAALPALSAMLQSNDSFAVDASVFVLAKLARHDVTLVAGLPDLPGAPLQALAAVMGGASAGLAVAACVVLGAVVAGCGGPAQRVLGAPGVEEAVIAAISHPDQRVVTNALGIVGAAERSDEGYVARLARAPGKLQLLLCALNSPDDSAVNNAAKLLSLVCQTDAELAQQAAAEPGVLRALAAQLSRGGCDAAVASVEALAGMAVGDGRCPRPDVLRRLAAEEGVLLALAAAAQSGGRVAHPSVRVLTAISSLPEEQIARMLCGVESMVPALVSVVRTSADALTVRFAAHALKHIAATSPQDLGRRVLDAGAAEAAVEAMAREPDQAMSDLLQALLAVNAAKVAAVLAAALPPPATVTTISARAVLASASLSLGPVAVEALAHAAEAAATLRARMAALEALASAAAAEADATRLCACAACGLQRESTAAGRLWPCAGCSGKGPAGRVLYCDADCQRAHWPAHKAYCKRAAAAAAAAAQSAPGGAA